MDKRAHLTPAQLALLEKRLKGKGGLTTAQAVQKDSVIPLRPDDQQLLSFAQERIWVMEQLTPGGATYNIPVAVEMNGRLDLDVLTRSINEVIARHETLRTTFHTIGGRPHVEIAPELAIEIQLEDICHLAPAERQTEATRIAVAFAQLPFDLSAGPLLRATAIRKADDQHELVLIMHHIIADGWSLGVLIREIATLYAAFSTGGRSELSPLPIQYADFAHWQKEPAQQAQLDQHLRYWKEQLGGSIEPLALPTDRPRPSEQTFRGATERFLVPKSLTESIKRLGEEAGTTLFMTLLAAFKTLLARYSGQSDLLVGSPIANRNRREVEGLIGVFINTLVLRSRVESKLTFRQLLQQVRQTTLDAFAHQDMPFEKLVDELQPDRNMAHSPFFQAMFIMQNAPLALTMQGLTLTSHVLDAGTAKYEITLSMRETEAGLIGEWEYNLDLFDRSTAARMITHFLTLLAGIAADPDLLLSALPLLSTAERQTLLHDWNDTQVPDRADICIHQAFEQQVERTPDEVAVVFEDRICTFRELNNLANRLAAQLQARGVEPDDLVGIYMDRSVEMIVALLATLKAGGGYLPLDPSYPHERIAYMIEDAQPKAILTNAHLHQQLPPHRADILILRQEESSGQVPNPVSQARPEHLAYIIYTSGSTGKPKGVMVEHRNAVRFFTGMDEAIGCKAADAMLAVTSIGFDISVLELFWTLTRGAKVVLLSDREVSEAGISQSEHSLRNQLVRHGATMLQCTPSLMSMLTLHPTGTSALEGLQKILLGGEALPLALARQLKERTSARLFNMYGPTEATVWATSYEVVDVDRLNAIPLGRPIANYQLFILDDNLQPVPVGVAGELHIGGLGVTRGYLNRPELTAERFIANPFGAGRLYKTGDLACYLPDGAVKFLGRLDHQVKVRGHRIELGEIETHLAERPEIREAVVVVRDNALVAYLVTESGELPDAAALRSELRGSLPDYMVPTSYVLLESMPLTPNGKVDRKALPEPEGAPRAAAQSYVPPSTPLEWALTAIWSDVLGVEKVGVHDHFFARGGHSLLATQLVSRVISDLQLTLSLRDVFNGPTVREMAQLLASRTDSASIEQVAPIRQSSRERERIASYSQERLWFLELLEPGNAAHNVPEIVRVTGAIDLEALSSALREICCRHDILRTAFADRDGQAIQVVQPTETFSFNMEVIDLSDLPQAEREAQAERIAEAVTNTPFDLTHAPLMRFKVVKMGEQDHLVAPAFHHIITDAWSMGVFFLELQALYEAYSHDEASPLAEMSIQFSDYALWQRDWLAGESIQAQLSYWQDKLRGDLPVLQLPTDRPRPAIQTHRGSRHTLHLPKALSEQVHRLAQQEGTTLYMTLLAGYKSLLHLYSGQSDIIVGSPIANRQKKELEALIGFFVNTLVLRTSVTPEMTYRELLQQVRQTALDAYAHQDVPFEKLVEKLAPKRDLSYTPLFQTMFVLQNTPMTGLQLPGMSIEAAGVTITRVGVEKRSAQFDLQLIMADSPDGLMGQIEYNTDLFDERTIVRMAEHFQTLLAHVVESPDEKIEHVHPFDDAEVAEFSAKRSLHLPPVAALPKVKRAKVAPRTAVEAELADVFREVFHLDQVGVHDSFFDLGGHSLLATRVMSRVNSRFAVDLPLRSLFEAPSVAELARLIEGGETPSHLPTPILPAPREEHLPLSFAQERMWFLDQLQPGAATYHLASALRLRGKLNESALLRSFQEVISRHESLRTSFANRGGQPMQIIAPAVELDLPVVAVTSDAEARRIAEEEAQAPFDLSSGPLVRAKLLRAAAEDHLLLLTMHHIVTDEWSMGIFVEEMVTLYGEYAAGKAPFLQELPIQYADYSVWQRNWLQGDVLQHQLDYWKQQLGGELPVLELPTDYPRPAVQSDRGNSLTFALDKGLTEKLNLLSQQEGATLFMTMLAAFKTLLFRYTGQADLLVGSPIAGRGREEIERLIGFFVNTLVLRTDLSGEPTFRELLARVRQTALDAYAHQDVPFEKLVEELQPKRQMSFSPLFQVLFTLQNAPSGSLAVEGLTLTPEVLDSGTAKFDLTLALVEAGDSLTGTIEYSTDLFAPATIARLADHFRTLLDSIVQQPDADLHALRMLTDREEQQLLGEWTQIERASEPIICLHHRFEEQVAATPEAEAIVCGEQRLTYRELNERANRLAHYLQRQGVVPETLVALCLERSPEMVVAVLGVLKAGGAYVPIDPTYPPDRIATMLSVCNPPLLLTDQELELATETRVIRLEEATKRQIELEPTANLSSSVQPHNLAYIIFTSGTTGVPKGVMIQHDTLHQVSEIWRSEFDLDQHVVRSLQYVSLSFDVFVGDLMRSLLTGGALVIVPSDIRLDLQALYRLMQDEQITVLDATPGLIVPLMELIWQNRWPLDHLKLLLVGADAFASNDYVTLLDRFGDRVRIANCYGITETTIDSSSFEARAGEYDPRLYSTVPIGRPIANTRMYILDAKMNLQPVGLAGELYIGGTGIGRGYYNRPDLTEERFMPNPFVAGERLYKTGDLARWLPDGNVQYIGRIDHQIKLRGYRIELGEIEAVLNEHPLLFQSVLTVWREELVAYYIGEEVAAAELRHYLKARLPAHMVPTHYLQLDQFPLSPNGKIDRRALPAPEVDARSIEHVEPRTPTEKRVAALWAKLLRTKEVSVHDNFFEIGGHSLLATQLVTQVQAEFEVTLSLRALFEKATVAELAELIEASAREAVPEVKRLERVGSRKRG
ncbi:amino acid adenylation domain-containing protein [Tumebacillus lipolyticus]|uniref:Amino acid adenylation domain-containing protein n=1 Tax=Tumebacillus lipolyticus TaxID=1280370 RepID=A0ABW4ZZG7_9BACL